MKVYLLANHAVMGGGEVMLLNTAAALRDLGHEPHVVCPTEPGELTRAAQAAGFAVTTIPGADNWRYLMGLRLWALRHRQQLMWCHGLRPSLALTGRMHRFAHLHQIPRGVHRAVVAVARWRASQVLLPSQTAAAHVPGAVSLSNWTAAMTPNPKAAQADLQGAVAKTRPFTFGYLGRISVDKGIGVLLEAYGVLRRVWPDEQGLRLAVAGEPRFTNPEEGADLLASMHAEPGVDVVGWVESARFLESVDALVVPSTAPESFGLVAAEAMAAGVPVIATDAGALPEVVGFAHPLLSVAGDSASLARAMQRVLEMPARQRQELCDQQRQRWEQEWSPQAGLQRVGQILGTPQTLRGSTVVEVTS